ncbi:hypothetical protein [Salmonirosea aquatica]|uniref:Lipocalin-like domain-containing protein n=1 Tax=Salmonirosea aquatica TaxID=2654236 RepID=A0A7C9BCB2_9BACT|nr:hypothetical protein [Cytophagaceae bacterium SJW1-29]
MIGVKFAKWAVGLGLMVGFSCQNEKDVQPKIVASLTETWWCDNQSILPDQYFGAEGNYRQRQNGQTQSGQWKIADDNKAILISNFGVNGEGTWSYGLKDLQTDKLVFTFYGADNSFGKCQ